MDQSWKNDRKPREYTVEIRPYTQTTGSNPQPQAKSQVKVTAPSHCPRCAAIRAGAPASARTVITGTYSNEVHWCDLPADTKVRNWTEWVVIDNY